MISALGRKLQSMAQGAMMEEAYENLEELGFFRKDSEEIANNDKFFDVLRDNAGDKILVFDTECIENNDDYAGLTHLFFEHAGLDSHLTKVGSELDHDKELARVSFSIDGQEFSHEWKQLSDYIDAEFLDFVDKTIKDKLNVTLFVLPAEDQCAEIIFLPLDKSEAFDEYLESIYKSEDPDYQGNQKVLAAILLGVLIILLASVTGYFVGKFWSLTIGGIFAAIILFFWQTIAIQKEVAEMDALRELQEEDPAEFVKLLVKTAKEEVKNRK